MKDRLGVEMTVLASDDRTRLMKGMILRRLNRGQPLVKHQLDTAIEQDIDAIKRKFSAFEFESYIGVDLETFYTSMEVGMLINKRDGRDEPLFDRGKLADEFIAGLSEDMEWMVDSLPMSTRGFFDNLKSHPDKSRQITVNAREFVQDHVTGKKRVVYDHTQDDRNQGRAGPIVREH
jgi:hypothetical protein